MPVLWQFRQYGGLPLQYGHLTGGLNPLPPQSGHLTLRFAINSPGVRVDL